MLASARFCWFELDFLTHLSDGVAVVCYTANRSKPSVKMVKHGDIWCLRLFWESLVVLGQLGWLLLLVM